jgi:glucose/arabinose dehydrogenase
MHRTITGRWALLAMLACSACGGGGSSPPPSGAPTATLTAPAALADGLAGPVVLAATASAEAGIAGVEFQLDGEPVGVEDTVAPYETSVDASRHVAGQHVVRARARDNAGRLSAWSPATVRFGGARTIGEGFAKADEWVGGLEAATAFVPAPDGRLFIAEQGGRVRIVKDGALLATPFHALGDVDSRGERGLIGIALHPQFASNGWVYVHYTTTRNGAHNRIGRLVASGDVSDGTEQVLVDLPPLSQATTHNGGALHFDDGGRLLVGVGDNADGSKAQDLADTFGKLLRFADDGSIPPDNPFCADALLRCAVWARGLRNPFTFALQPAGGRMHINDVGEHTWEEIDVGQPGANYGWPASEGPDNVGAGIVAPRFAYRHDDTVPPGSGPGGFLTGAAIAGGAFYPDAGPFPASHHGNYFFADFAGRWVARLDPANGDAVYAFASLVATPVDLRVGQDGALYVLSTSGITRIAAR